MAGIHQPVEYATQHPHVVEMEARRGLVEDVQLPLPTAAPAAAGESELARNLETLRFTPRQRRRRLAELEITETYLLEVPEAAREARMAMQSDRKSTRLNSSHVRISYAVFCLKKKKKMNRCIISMKTHESNQILD